MSLNRFVKELHEKKCRFQLSEYDVNAIEDAVHYVVKEYLPENFKRLPRAIKRHQLNIADIISTGSYYERTKIQNPKEFDFMLVVQELSEPGAISIEKGCKPGHVKVKATDPDRWGKVSPDQTGNKSFELALLEFNAYVRFVIERCPLIRSPAGDRELVLKRKNVVARGKPYKDFSHVQTAYFVWRRRERKKTCKATVIYSRTGNLDPGEEWEGDDNFITEDILDIDVDLMACCQVPFSSIQGYVDINIPLKPVLDSNGCHVVLKPCGNMSVCDALDTTCRLVSYTKSERGVMRDLDLNWKIIYRVMKWLLGYSDFLGLDSYRLKTAILHLSLQQPTVSLSKGILATWQFLQTCAKRRKLPSFFDRSVDVWNLPIHYDLFIRWKLALLLKIFQQIDEIPEDEYDYNMMADVLEGWIYAFCGQSLSLHQIEGRLKQTELDLLCDQGNPFVAVLDEMQPYLAKHEKFKRISPTLKYYILLEDFRVLSKIFVFKLMNFSVKHILPVWSSVV